VVVSDYASPHPAASTFSGQRGVAVVVTVKRERLTPGTLIVERVTVRVPPTDPGEHAMRESWRGLATADAVRRVLGYGDAQAIRVEAALRRAGVR
jgi:hypothetical protein